MIRLSSVWICQFEVFNIQGMELEISISLFSVWVWWQRSSISGLGYELKVTTWEIQEVGRGLKTMTHNQNLGCVEVTTDQNLLAIPFLPTCPHPNRCKMCSNLLCCDWLVFIFEQSPLPPREAVACLVLIQPALTLTGNSLVSMPFEAYHTDSTWPNKKKCLFLLDRIFFFLKLLFWLMGCLGVKIQRLNPQISQYPTRYCELN